MLIPALIPISSKTDTANRLSRSADSAPFQTRKYHQPTGRVAIESGCQQHDIWSGFGIRILPIWIEQNYSQPAGWIENGWYQEFNQPTFHRTRFHSWPKRKFNRIDQYFFIQFTNICIIWRSCIAISRRITFFWRSKECWKLQILAWRDRSQRPVMTGRWRNHWPLQWSLCGIELQSYCLGLPITLSRSINGVLAAWWPNFGRARPFWLATRKKLKSWMCWVFAAQYHGRNGRTWKICQSIRMFGCRARTSALSTNG